MLLWALPIVIVLGIAVGAVGWYARKSYYVGLDRQRVTVFKGVPGGLAGWNPTIERRTNLTTTELRQADLAAVKKHQTFSSLADAEVFVARIRAKSTTTTTTTTPTTTTTVAPGAVTTAPPVTAAPAGP